MSSASGRGPEDRVHTPQSPFVSATPLQETNLLSRSDIIKTITKRIEKSKDPIRVDSLVAYEFLEESQGDWRWSIGQVKELTPHSVSIQKWRCEHGNNSDLVDALRRDQLVKTKLLKESSQSIFSLRAELGSVRTKNEAEMARVRSELEQRQKPLSVADDDVWTSVLRCAGTGKPQAQSLSLLLTAVVRLVDQRSTTQVLSWIDVARAAQHPTFLDRLYRYDVWYDMSTEQFECAKALVDDHTDLQQINIDRAIRDAAVNAEVQAYVQALYMWLKAQVQAFTTYLECASTQEYANSLQQQLFDCVQNLKDLNRKMGQIKEKLALYANGGAGMDEEARTSNSFTFVPTHGIYATLLRSSIIITLREKSREIAVLGKDDVDEILVCSSHLRPNLHVIIGEMLQNTSIAEPQGQNKEKGMKHHEDAEEMRRRLADTQSQNEALREELQEMERKAERQKRELGELKERSRGSGNRDSREIGEQKAEKEIKNLQEALTKCERENKRLEAALRDAEMKKQREQVSSDRDLERDNKKLQQELQKCEKELEKLKERLREVEKNSANNINSRLFRSSDSSSRNVEEKLKKLQDENKRLKNEVEELEDSLRKFRSRRNSSSTTRSALLSPFKQLLLEEKCDRLKIERSMIQRWASLLSLDRTKVLSYGEAHSRELLEELDLLSSDYTDSLEKLEEFMTFLEEARRSEKKLRDRLAFSENEVFSLQATQDSTTNSRQRSIGSPSPSRIHRESETNNSKIHENLLQLRLENQELLSIVKSVSLQNDEKQGRSGKQEYRDESRGSVDSTSNEALFSQTFLRMRSEIEQLKKEREALEMELMDRESEIEQLNQQSVKSINELNRKIEISQQSAQHMKGMLRGITELRKKKKHLSL